MNYGSLSTDSNDGPPKYLREGCNLSVSQYCSSEAMALSIHTHFSVLVLPHSPVRQVRLSFVWWSPPLPSPSIEWIFLLSPTMLLPMLFCSGNFMPDQLIKFII